SISNALDRSASTTVKKNALPFTLARRYWGIESYIMPGMVGTLRFAHPTNWGYSTPNNEDKPGGNQQ
ncbi:MAG: hypothetical protein PS018_19845, partial [bacterium]|nr:hypothetical protein [bacterium]